MNNKHSLETAAQPTCPVCNEDMIYDELIPISFSDGRRNHVVKFICSQCHIETQQTVKNADNILLREAGNRRETPLGH